MNVPAFEVDGTGAVVEPTPPVAVAYQYNVFPPTAVAVSAAGNVIIAAASDGTVWRTSRNQLVQNTGNLGWVQSNVGGGSNSWTSIAMNRLGSVIWLVGNNTHLYFDKR